MKILLTFTALATSLFAGYVPPAAAAVATFEEYGDTTDCYPSAASGGLVISGDNDVCVAYGPGNDYQDWPTKDHGSDFLGAFGGFGQTTIARDGGGPFSLLSLESATGVFADESGFLTFVGNLLSGGTISQTVAIDRAFRTISFANWSNLSSVNITASIGDGYFGLDNIVYDIPQAVPEPAMVGLLGLGVVGLGLHRRRKAVAIRA